MTITAPTSCLNAASTNTTNGGTNAVTKTLIDVPRGFFFIIGLGGGINDKFTAFSDSAGNKWTVTQSTTNPSSFGALAWSFIQKAMPIGTSFTATQINSGAWNFDGGWKVSGVGIRSDFSATGVNSSSLQVSVTQAVNKSPWGGRIIFGQTSTSNTAGTYTESVGFTNLVGAAVSSFGGIGYQIASATTSTTYAPTWTSASADNWQVISFLANAPTPKPKIVRAVRRGFS